MKVVVAGVGTVVVGVVGVGGDVDVYVVGEGSRSWCKVCVDGACGEMLKITILLHITNRQLAHSYATQLVLQNKYPATDLPIGTSSRITHQEANTMHMCMQCSSGSHRWFGIDLVLQRTGQLPLSEVVQS